MFVHICVVFVFVVRYSCAMFYKVGHSSRSEHRIWLFRPDEWPS